jgi:hypothetical protein
MEKEALPKREVGHLACDTCQRLAPYTGFADPALDGGWPMHRCGRVVRPFDRWTKDDPAAAADRGGAERPPQPA